MKDRNFVDYIFEPKFDTPPAVYYLSRIFNIKRTVSLTTETKSMIVNKLRFRQKFRVSRLMSLEFHLNDQSQLFDKIHLVIADKGASYLLQIPKVNLERTLDGRYLVSRAVLDNYLRNVGLSAGLQNLSKDAELIELFLHSNQPKYDHLTKPKLLNLLVSVLSDELQIDHDIGMGFFFPTRASSKLSPELLAFDLSSITRLWGFKLTDITPLNGDGDVNCRLEDFSVQPFKAFVTRFWSETFEKGRHRVFLTDKVSQNIEEEGVASSWVSEKGTTVHGDQVLAFIDEQVLKKKNWALEVIGIKNNARVFETVGMVDFETRKSDVEQKKFGPYVVFSEPTEVEDIVLSDEFASMGDLDMLLIQPGQISVPHSWIFGQKVFGRNPVTIFIPIKFV